MKPKGHAVLLHPDSPSTLFAMLKDDVHSFEDDMKMLFAASISYEQPGFLEVVLVATDERPSWTFSIAQQYIVAIADLPLDSDNNPTLGFRP